LFYSSLLISRVLIDLPHLAKAGLTVPFKHFPWKNLVKVCSEKGIVIENWPDEVPFPCDETRSKGINGLSAKERNLLLNSFVHEKFRLRLAHRYRKDGTLVFNIYCVVLPYAFDRYTCPQSGGLLCPS
jgi:hypothetical protein